MRHLLNINQFNANEITEILDIAENYLLTPGLPYHKLDYLKGTTVANLFYEPSTRTRCSFTLAAQRLGADVLDIDIDSSSSMKGETITDTILTLQEMNVTIFVLRFGNLLGIPEAIATKVYDHVSIINAGEGTVSHPTQGLLDLLTIRQHKESFKGLKVVIVGDILHSRVARTAIEGLQIMGVDDICLVSPEEFAPITTTCDVTTNLRDGLRDADVVMALRIQNERLDKDYDIKEYVKNYCITEQLLGLAKDDVILMHPGPINRGIDIESKLVDTHGAAIMQQVRNGVAIRMAVLEMVAR